MKTYKKFAKNFRIISEPSLDYIHSAKLNTSQDVRDYAIQLYDDKTIDVYESFFIILLNRSNGVIGYAKIGQGGISGTVSDTRIMLKYAIEILASSMILVHNHPSGNTKPSKPDIDITNKTRIAAAYHDIQILDHVILTEGNAYYSFADEGFNLTKSYS